MLACSPPWPIGLEMLFLLGCYGLVRLRANLEEMDGLEVIINTTDAYLIMMVSWPFCREDLLFGGNDEDKCYDDHHHHR